MCTGNKHFINCDKVLPTESHNVSMRQWFKCSSFLLKNLRSGLFVFKLFYNKHLITQCYSISKTTFFMNPAAFKEDVAACPSLPSLTSLHLCLFWRPRRKQPCSGYTFPWSYLKVKSIVNIVKRMHFYITYKIKHSVHCNATLGRNKNRSTKVEFIVLICLSCNVWVSTLCLWSYQSGEQSNNTTKVSVFSQLSRVLWTSEQHWTKLSTKWHILGLAPEGIQTECAQ